MARERRSGAINGWCPWIGLVLWAIVSTMAFGSTSPPHEYQVLTPEPLSGPISVMSLEPSNTIAFGGSEFTLQQYETASIPDDAFTAGTKFSGTGFFTAGSDQNAADLLLVADDFVGTSFVVPHVAGSHRYFLSPSGTAQVTIRTGAAIHNVIANEGVVNEFDADSDNTVATSITSDVPIVVAHVAYTNGSPHDAFPVAPAASEIWGIRSPNSLLAALDDGTSVVVYASDGRSSSLVLNAGQQIALTVGAATANGQGSALHVIANAPAAAIQYDGGDGTDVAAFWASSSFGRRHGLPINAQFLAIARAEPSVTLTLYNGANPPEMQTRSGTGTTPRKAYFGSASAGANLAAGWCSSPVYVMYEAATSEDEHNLPGLAPVAGPAEPSLISTVSSSRSDNPQSISGTAGANQLARLHANGSLQATTTADGSGACALNAALIDRTNRLTQGASAVLLSDDHDGRVSCS
jgi:hypothetical protein